MRARRPVPAGRHDEPRGGRAAAAAARPVRADRRGGRLARARRSARRSSAAGSPTTPTRPRSPRAGPTRRPQLRRRASPAARALLPSVLLGDARAAPDHRGLRRVRRRRPAGRPGHRAHRHRAGGLGRARRTSPRRTSGRPRGSRCRTGAAATRSTRRAWTRTSSTRRWRQSGGQDDTGPDDGPDAGRDGGPGDDGRGDDGPADDGPGGGGGRPAPEPVRTAAHGRTARGRAGGEPQPSGAAERPPYAPPSRSAPGC